MAMPCNEHHGRFALLIIIDLSNTTPATVFCGSSYYTDTCLRPGYYRDIIRFLANASSRT